jgi:ABC-type phosphate transport system substrate-binding protein
VYLDAAEVNQAQATVGEAVFQIPLFFTPLALPVGQMQNVHLTTTDVCNLFSGSTNVSQRGDVFSKIVVRSDSNGASYVFSNFLAQNCPPSLGFNQTNGFPSTAPNWTAVFNLNGGNIALDPTNKSDAAANAIASTPGALGYVSVDYAYPIVPNSTAYPAYLNGRLPTLAYVRTRLETLTYPSTYDAATIGQQLNDSFVAPGGEGYPLGGFSFIDTYSCYSTSIANGIIGGPPQGKALLAVVKSAHTATFTGILNAAGYLQPPAAVIQLLESSGGPLNQSSGIQNSSCPQN